MKRGSVWRKWIAAVLTTTVLFTSVDLSALAKELQNTVEDALEEDAQEEETAQEEDTPVGEAAQEEVVSEEETPQEEDTREHDSESDEQKSSVKAARKHMRQWTEMVL